jgi:hypothetical protein
MINAGTPLAKCIGRSYNPIWFNQSLCELVLPEENQDHMHFLSAQGAEPKIYHYIFNRSTHQL